MSPATQFSPLRGGPKAAGDEASTATSYDSFVTDKADNSTINAGDVADLDGPGPLPEGAITGVLELTETTIAFRFIVTPEESAAMPLTASGSYTVSGSTLTAVTFRTETFAIGLRGNRLTLESDKTTSAYDKQ